MKDDKPKKGLTFEQLKAKLDREWKAGKRPKKGVDRERVRRVK